MYLIEGHLRCRYCYFKHTIYVADCTYFTCEFIVTTNAKCIPTGTHTPITYTNLF